MKRVISVSNLNKAYGEIQAVNGITFDVKQGSLFAFLGPNGAGKSTTVDILCTILRPSKGTVFINGFELGKDDNQIRSSIGVVFQDRMLDDLLTVRENLLFRASFYGLKGKNLKKSIDFAVSATNCRDFLSHRYGKLSGGQKRRADIARALLNTPKILFLDEPTTGLDPQTRRQVWKSIRNLQNESGITVFLTTHYMEEAADADDVAIIKKGIIVASGSPAHLKQEYGTDMLKLLVKNESVEHTLISMNISYKKKSDLISVPVKSSLNALEILDRVRDNISSFEMINGTMDDVFISIIGNEQEEELYENNA